MNIITNAQFAAILQIIRNDPQRLHDMCTAISLSLIELEKAAYAYMEKVSELLQAPLRVPMHTSKMSGADWVNELLNGHPVRCFNALRMNRNTFLNLCYLLEYKYQIDNTTKLTVKERVAWFLRTLSHRCANRDSMERFQHSGSTVCDHFGDILDACNRLGGDIVKPRDPTYNSVPSQIVNSTKYFPTFKDCVGALDGCHVELTVPEKYRLRFINRKGVTSTNVLAVCDFDLLFVFLCVGWEGSAHDTRVYLNSINDANQLFPNPPAGKYYLGDKGYPDRNGLMTPHNRVRYHQSEFRAENPRGAKERFNKIHSSLRSAIERSFGVLKARWQILLKVPSYPIQKQMQIVNACFVLHNYTRLSTHGDPCFSLFDSSPFFIPTLVGDHGNVDAPAPPRQPVLDSQGGSTGTLEMQTLKNQLTAEMVTRCNQTGI